MFWTLFVANQTRDVKTF